MTVLAARQKTSFWSRYRDFLLSRNTILAFSGALLLVIASILYMRGYEEIGDWIFLASALIGGLPLFLLAGQKLIFERDITVGVMASAAMIAAIIIGEYDAAALVVFMMSVGEWLEDFTAARADNALKELASLVPATVTVRRNGTEQVIPIDEVVLNDIVLVRTGERIGVDGKVVSGTGSVNQAAITGESMPVEKEKGDDVFAGTVNELGALEIQVGKLGDDTTLGQIVNLVKYAKESKAPVERTANKYARILVPFTFSIAAIVGVVTGDVIRSVTILVVICPCALVLATPTAVMAAIGNAAKRGMLVKSGTAVEHVGRVNVVAFDKTGTLTLGEPEVKEVISYNGLGSESVLQLAASAERFSEHPIGRAIVQAAEKESLGLSEPVDFGVQPGFGVTAKVDGKQVAVGKPAMLAEFAADDATEVKNKVLEIEEQGYTVVSVAVDGEAAGLIALADTPRAEAKNAIRELKALGIQEVIMITGDNARVAKMVADELGVDRFFAEVMPQRKLEIIREIQAEGKSVAFAGDGVNDAPALAAADVGIAMGVAGTDVALETADVGLMQDEIERVPQVISLSRRTLKVIRQNIIFSMGMNLLALILGSFGIIGPVIGALMHESSSLPVLANSARLVDARYRRPTL
jgi:Cd2+/Zn2+-exporting ATPase